jgi:glyoxylase-like metal-dependent hydrolase (beta-lactamase superfamily II)
VARFTVPLDLASPDHLNCHLLDLPSGQLLVDCGTSGSSGPLEAGLAACGAETPEVLLTHGHIDHWGCATRISAQAHAHPEVEYSLRFARGDLDQGHGTQTPEWAAIEQAFSGFRELVIGVPEVVPLDDGQRLGDWEVLWTPGHDPGHICLWRELDGTLLCGDLLLPGFTPNIQPAPGHDDTLQEFFDSLDRVAALPVRLVLPAHGEPYADAAGRARELECHHRDRLRRISDLIAARPRSTEDIASRIFGEIDDPGERMLASMETVAHLEHLDRKGSVVSSELGWCAA